MAEDRDIQEVRASLKANPDSLADMFTLCHAYKQAGRLQEALVMLRRMSLRTRPEFTDDVSRIWSGMANVLYRLNRHMEALRVAERAIVADRENDEAWEYAALAAVQLGKADIACSSYREAVRFCPENEPERMVALLVAYARCLRLVGQVNAAIHYEALAEKLSAPLTAAVPGGH